MICEKCKSENNDNEKFCKACGTLINRNEGTNVEATTSSPEAKKVVNENVKKFGIFSVLIGSIGIFFTLFIGMSLYLSLIFGALGITFATRCKMKHSGLATSGYILNGIFMGLGALNYILYLITEI